MLGMHCEVCLQDKKKKNWWISNEYNINEQKPPCKPNDRNVSPWSLWRTKLLLSNASLFEHTHTHTRKKKKKEEEEEEKY